MNNLTSSEPFYITTPIYYVNDKPHIGSAYTTLMCDTISRFYRLQGRPVYFLTGTDEHGQKVQKAAEKANMAPKDFVDEVSKSFRELVDAMQVTNDVFIRTTEERHYAAAQALWNKLLENGYIYLDHYEGWYSVRDEAFYDEKELVNGKAPTGADVEWMKEESYFFKLSAFQEPLLKWYEEHPHFIAPDSRRNEVLRFVEGGLQDLSISRTSFSWGVPVPGNDKHIMYVWLDALTNYITALGYPDENHDLFQQFWKHTTHVVGKDILRFHAVYWPAFLMAANLPLPQQIFAHGWWTNEGVKISKSLGNTIDPIELIETFGIDAVRYFLAREVPFGQDGDFSRQNLINRLNTDLANAYGNLVQRVLSFINKNAGAAVPSHQNFSDEEIELLDSPLHVLAQINIMQTHKYAELVWTLIARGNQYMDSNKPWELKKTDEVKMNHCLYILCELIRKIAILTQPLVPNASGKILDQLAITADKRQFINLRDTLKSGTALPVPFGVFPRFQA